MLRMDDIQAAGLNDILTSFGRYLNWTLANLRTDIFPTRAIR